MENEKEIKKRLLQKLHQTMMGGELKPLLQISICAAGGEGEMESEGEEPEEKGEMEMEGPPSELSDIIQRKKRERAGG